MAEESSTPEWPASELVPGVEIAGYKIISVVTGGGWGRVYKAERKNGDQFAFKTIRPDLADDPTFRRRFQREQSALRKLRGHPNLLPASDWGGPREELLWLAVPWIDGPTLHGLLKDGPLAAERAANLIAQAAEGLEAVHAKFGYVHRDLHPGNMMVKGDDHLLVIDFGLAKPFDHASGSPLLPERGKWNSPEVLEGKKLTPAADIYSLGLVLAYLVTGMQPLGNAPVFPPGVEVPPELRSVIERATQRKPGKRFQSAQKMAEALRRVSQPPQEPPTDSVGQSVHRRLALGPVALAAIAVAAAVFLLVIVQGSGEGSDEVRVGAGGISLEVPAPWSTSTPVAADRKLGMRVLATGSSTAALIGFVPPDGLPARNPQNHPYEVALPAGKALRIEEVKSLRARRTYLFHAGGTYPALVCRGSAAAIKQVDRTCARLAATVELPQRSVSIPAPDPRLRRQAADGLHAYAAARREATHAIEAAETHAAAAAAAEGAAKAAAKAAGEVPAAELASIRRALEGASEAWESAAKAARRGSGFHHAGREVERAEKQIEKARRRLLSLGFRG